MKYYKILTILLLSSVISFFACNENAPKQNDRESPEVSDSPTLPNAATPEPAQNFQGVWHYTCSKGCTGGAGAAGTCATCGGPLAHNSAYHANGNNTPTTSTTSPISPITTPPAAEPAQNAAGIWHYTCGKGCSGGAGAAGTCGTCSGPLVHNAAYHQ